MAWLLNDSATPATPATPDISTLDYWAVRVAPLWNCGRLNSSGTGDGDESGAAEKGKDRRRVIFAICNRTGTEDS